MNQGNSSINDMLQGGAQLFGGKYRIVRHLASGGFGNTYEAVNTTFEAKCAIKEFFMSGVNHRGDDTGTVQVSNPTMTNTFETAKAKFKKEAQRLYKLHNDHIVRVHDLFEENNTVYYVMDFVEGKSLSQVMKAQGHPFSESQVRDILLQMTDALRCIHGQKLWHMDIKPGNIMMDASGRCTLIDFGASKQTDMDSSGATSSAIAQTPGYAPMEQVNGNKDYWGPWTDIYALGATIYNLLTGNRPPLSDDISIRQSQAFSFPETVSQQMRRLVIRMMSPVYVNRPQNVDEVEALLSSSTPETPSAPPKDEVATQYGGGGNVGAYRGGQPNKDADGETKYESGSAGAVDQTVVSRPESDKPKDSGKDGKNKTVRMLGIAAGVLASILLLVFMLKNTNDGDEQKQGQSSEQNTVPTDSTITANGVSFKMIYVQGGTFLMGATKEQGSEAEDDEKPAHSVSLSDYYIGQTEVTQELWQAVMGSNPSYYKGSRLPMESVSWGDCQKFITKLNSLTGQHFRLPTEAEWEFAARGGNLSQGYKYSGSNTLSNVAWCDDNSGEQTHNVATKSPNELGIYDMSGNVWEWCSDRYGENYYAQSPSSNPQGSSSGSCHVFRGGSFVFISEGCRVAYRSFPPLPDYSGDPGLGLRLAL